MSYIDISTTPPPSAIEPLDFEAMWSDFRNRFVSAWADLREGDPTLPPIDSLSLETDPIAVVGQAWAYLRLLDRQRVNDAVRAVLAPTAAGANLDNIAAGRGLSRITVIPATRDDPAVMETDAQLLRRYLLSFLRPAAGSAEALIYHALTVVPGANDVAVRGWATHGRRGDADLVVSGPDAADLTVRQFDEIRSRAFAPDAYPEALGGYLRRALRAEYDVQLRLTIPGGGPAAEVALNAARDRVRNAALVRRRIGASVPASLIVGAAYGDGSSVAVVEDLAPVDHVAEPYTVPILRALDVTAV